MDIAHQAPELRSNWERLLRQPNRQRLVSAVVVDLDALDRSTRFDPNGWDHE